MPTSNIMFIFVAIVVTVLIFVFMFLYDLWSPVMAHTMYNMDLLINETNETENPTAVSNARQSLGNVRIMWRYWILILVFLLIIWLFIATQKVEPGYTTYGGY